MGKSAIGIDLGGTNLKGIIMDSDGNSRHLTRIPTDAHKGGSVVMQNIIRLIELLIEKEGSTGHMLGVGIGTPGFVSETGVVSMAENLPGWGGTEVYTPLRKKTGLKVIAANDVTTMALAESKFGAGRGVRNLVCYALGTGVGGGIIIDHKVYKGSHGMAGELGHFTVVPDGLSCTCGMRGCLECYASGPAIVNTAREMAAEYGKAHSTPFVNAVNAHPDAVTAKMVYEFVNKGDIVAVAVNESVCNMLARAIGMMLNALAPDRVVLGGGVMMAGSVIIEAVKRHIPRYCWPMILERVEIVAAELGEDAGAIGAAAMVFDEFGE